MAGVRVEDATTTYERRHRQDPDRRPASELADLLRRLPRLARHALDQARASTCCSSFTMAVLSFPLMVLTALAIRLESSGPVLYRQERVGENGRMLHALQVPLDAHRRREGRHADLGERRRRPHHPRRPLHPQDAARRAAAALERDARRHELRRPAARAAVLRRRARQGDPVLPAAPRGEARADRLGAGEVPLRLVASKTRWRSCATTSTTSSTSRCSST